MRIFYVALVALVVGCGGSDDQESSAGADVGPDDVAAENYDIAYTVCEAVLNGPVDQGDITADPATRPAAFAHEYAEGYGDAYRQPVYDGCLDALEGRVNREER